MVTSLFFKCQNVCLLFFCLFVFSIQCFPFFYDYGCLTHSLICFLGALREDFVMPLMCVRPSWRLFWLSQAWTAAQQRRYLQAHVLISETVPIKQTTGGNTWHDGRQERIEFERSLSGRQTWASVAAHSAERGRCYDWNFPVISLLSASAVSETDLLSHEGLQKPSDVIVVTPSSSATGALLIIQMLRAIFLFKTLFIGCVHLQNRSETVRWRSPVPLMSTWTKSDMVESQL